MMIKRIVAPIMCVSAISLLLAGCGGSSTADLEDGTYEGKSEVYVADELALEDEEVDEAANGYGVVSITIEDGAITDCTYQTYEEDGTLKDEEYGKEDGEVRNTDYYNKAQKAVAACAEYADQLVETGDVKKVDTISGATINHDEFVEAVDAALEEAKQ